MLIDFFTIVDFWTSHPVNYANKLYIPLQRMGIFANYYNNNLANPSMVTGELSKEANLSCD